MEQFDKVCQAITRLFFFIYWIFDNLNILSTMKVINFDKKKMAKYGASFWLAALTVTLINTIRQLMFNYAKQQQQIKKSQKVSGGIKKIKQQRIKILLSLVKTVGDILPAGHGSQFFPSILKLQLNDGICGIGGLISSLITCYQLY